MVKFITDMSKGWRLLIGVFVILAGLIWGTYLLFNYNESSIFLWMVGFFFGIIVIFAGIFITFMITESDVDEEDKKEKEKTKK